MAAAFFGLTFATLNHQVSPVWPATGIAIGCVFAFGPVAAFGVLIGAFLANFHTGLNPISTLLLACGNTAEAYFAVMIFNKVTRVPNDINPHFRASVGFFAAACAATIAATNGPFVLYFSNVLPLEQLHTNWFTWWIGDTLGALFIVPFVMKLAARDQKPFELSRTGFVAFLVLLLSTSVLNHVIFTFPEFHSLFVALLIPLLITALFFNQGWIFVISIFSCFYAIRGTFHGLGPFAGNTMNENLIHLQLFLAGLGMTAVGLGTLPQRLTRYARFSIIAGWILTGIAVHSFYSTGIELDQLSFEKQVADAENEISHRLTNYVTLLKSGASFFDSSDAVTQREWKSFVRRILTDEQYNELDGIGVVFPVQSKSLDSFTKKIRIEENFEKFSVHTIPNVREEFKVTDPETHLVVTYIEPTRNNEQAIGLDLATEKNRYEAAMLARDTGQAQITGPIDLVDANGRPIGFLLYFPFYKSEVILTTPEQRKAKIKGFVFTPINFETFLKGALKPREKDLILLSYSGTPGTSGYRKIYQSPASKTNSTLVVRHTLTLAGRPLTFEWTRGTQFYSASAFIASWVAFTGTLCSLFLAILLASLEGLSHRAQKIADEKTKELTERNRQWQVLTESSPVGIFQTDTGTNMTYANPKWSEITGIDSQLATFELFQKSIHPEDFEHVIDEWSKFQAGGKFNVTFRFLKKDEPNGFVVVAALAVPVKNELGQITSYIGTIQDITELHIKQNALITSSRLSSLGEMASGVAHEINNPLTIIMSRAQRIESLLTLDHPDQKMLITQTEQIVKTAHRIAKIIKGLQSFARETTGEPFQVVPIKEVILNTMELCKERFSKHDILLEYPQEINDNWRFWGREEQISQVLMNLLNNAYDAIQDVKEKWVKIEINQINSKLIISVTDSGHGIADHVEAKMFSPFYTTKEVGKGTGLGLSISKGIVERHGGVLYFDKTAKNTRFVLELNIY